MIDDDSHRNGTAHMSKVHFRQIAWRGTPPPKRELEFQSLRLARRPLKTLLHFWQSVRICCRHLLHFPGSLKTAFGDFLSFANLNYRQNLQTFYFDVILVLSKYKKPIWPKFCWFCVQVALARHVRLSFFSGPPAS